MKNLYNKIAIVVVTIAFVALTCSAVFANGVLFKVNIGSFDKEIAKEKLVGYDYVVYEVNKVFTYHVGEFKDYIHALKANDELTKRGFDKSEVIAFFNKTSISIEDAFTLMDNRNSVDEASYKSKTNNAPKAVINIEQGIIYTVQIGVYSKQQNENSFNIDDEIFERVINDVFNYSCGAFHSVSEAIAEKSKVVSLGIKDAFVVAYKDGKRITLQQAQMQ